MLASIDLDLDLDRTALRRLLDPLLPLLEVLLMIVFRLMATAAMFPLPLATLASSHINDVLEKILVLIKDVELDEQTPNGDLCNHVKLD